MSTWTAHRTPEPPHPFSHAVSGDEWVIISGIGGHGPDGSIPDDAAEQARAALATIAHLLEQAGSSMSEIVYFRPHVSAREHIAAMDAELRTAFPVAPPASGALIIVELADPRMKIEFEAWARRGATLAAQ